MHVPNFGGVTGSEDFACATLPTTPADFQGKIKNFCHPTLQKIRSKITVTPPKKRGRSQNYGASINSKFTFQKHFEEILGRCNTRCHRIRFLVNKKMGTQNVYDITNLQTMCTANFRMWLTFDRNNIGHNHQQNSAGPKQVHPTYPVFTKIHQC